MAYSNFYIASESFIKVLEQIVVEVTFIHIVLRCICLFRLLIAEPAVN